ncbi:MAG: ATP-grasp domain-containing protein [Planctomycetes bacterium]|nr:ATP-grasp domain-containing protein [Planctomycetota bacterium]
MNSIKVGITYDNSHVKREDIIEIKGVVDVIEKVLVDKKYRVERFGIDDSLRTFVRKLESSDVEVIVNLVEQVYGQSVLEVSVAGIYELLQIPYTGSNPVTLGLALYKARAKEILAYNGLDTPRHLLINSPEFKWKRGVVRFPIIVKPASEDGSVGISDSSVVKTIKELKEKVASLYEQFKQPILVEEFIEGRELNVAIVGNNPAEILPISEIDFSGLPPDKPKIVTYDAKWKTDSVEYKGTVPICPAVLEPDIENDVKEVALEAYNMFGCRDYARIDIRLGLDNVPYILEVNPNPDISPDAGLARSVRVRGWTYEDFVEKLVKNALLRAVKA